MVARSFVLALGIVGSVSTVSSAQTPVTPAAARADTDTVSARIVRRFPPVEVRALLDDLRSSQTVHLIPGSVLRTLPTDGLADVLALQPGVVAQGEELHVRGGRSGETSMSLDGFGLNEPLRNRTMDVPLLALDGAELVSGAPDARQGGGIAGAFTLHSLNPPERLSTAWRWESDGRLDTHRDRVSARVSSPLHALGLGAVAAGDATLDDTWLPALRTVRRHDVLGLSLGWRADNRILGSLKLAPVREPERASAQILVSRKVVEPYSPNWSLDGWTYLPPSTKQSPVFSTEPQPGYLRYRAADHLAITDERQLAALFKVARLRARSKASLGVSWLRTRAVTSVSGGYEPETASHRPLYGYPADRDQYYVLWGDYPLYRQSASDVITLRGDAEQIIRSGARLMGGAGLRVDDASMLEIDWLQLTKYGPGLGPLPLDSVRTYDVRAPGAFAYLQSRWETGGLVLNTGLRAEYFTAGAAADHQTLPGHGGGFWSFAPRLGAAYPISVRDVFSFAYVRMQQAPARDYLYDRRVSITNRQPLGNPALGPATLISYEAAVKHLFGPTWALQASVFYRDVFGQIGALDFSVPAGPTDLRYVDDVESSAVGFEASLIHANGDRAHFEAHYTWMQASGNESRPEGDPYGTLRQARTPPISSQPVSWDRRHSVSLNGAWRFRRSWSLGWTSAVGSPLPWTPKPRRQAVTNLELTNSRRLEWSEVTNLSLQWSPPIAHGLTFGFDARNLFNTRTEQAATLDGYPNPVINTIYDDYSAYRTETGLGGGAYWSTLPTGDPGHWVPAYDPRLYSPPRALRASIGGRW